MSFNNTSSALDSRSQKRAAKKAHHNVTATPEHTLRKQGAYDLDKQRPKFRLPKWSEV